MRRRYSSSISLFTRAASSENLEYAGHLPSREKRLVLREILVVIKRPRPSASYVSIKIRSHSEENLTVHLAGNRPSDARVFSAPSDGRVRHALGTAFPLSSLDRHEESSSGRIRRCEGIIPQFRRAGRPRAGVNMRGICREADERLRDPKVSDDPLDSARRRPCVLLFQPLSLRQNCIGALPRTSFPYICPRTSCQ